MEAEKRKTKIEKKIKFNQVYIIFSRVLDQNKEMPRI